MENLIEISGEVKPKRFATLRVSEIRKSVLRARIFHKFGIGEQFFIICLF
jgi:hypothetical protein